MGGGAHIGGLFFQNATGARFAFVPYRGGGPAMQDLAVGQIDVMIASTGDTRGVICPRIVCPELVGVKRFLMTAALEQRLPLSWRRVNSANC